MWLTDTLLSSVLKAKKIIKLQRQTKNSRKIFQWLNCTQKLHYKMFVFETEEGCFLFFLSQKCRKLWKLTFYNYGSWYYVSIEVNKPGAVSNKYCLTDWFLMYCSFHWETFRVKIYSLRWKRRLFIVFSVWWTKDSWTCDLDWTSFLITDSWTSSDILLWLKLEMNDWTLMSNVKMFNVCHLLVKLGVTAQQLLFIRQQFNSTKLLRLLYLPVVLGSALTDLKF